MALEIERKFQLPEVRPWLRDHLALEIEPGYLAIEARSSSNRSAKRTPRSNRHGSGET